MEKRLVIAAVLSLGILILWEWLVVPKPKPRPPGAASRAPATAVTAASPPGAPAVSKPRSVPVEHVAAAAEETMTLENAFLRVRFSNRGGVIQSILLLRHTDEKGHPLELIQRLPVAAPAPLALSFPADPEATKKVADAFFVMEREGERSVRLRYGDDRMAVSKVFRLGDGYLSQVKVDVNGPHYVLCLATGLRNPTETEQSSTYVMPATAVASSGGGLETERAPKVEKAFSWPVNERGFGGIEDNYFLVAFLPEAPATIEVQPVGYQEAGKDLKTIATGVSGNGTLSGQLFFGPKEVDTLEKAGRGLDRTVNFGWLTVVGRPLLWLLKTTYSRVNNYGLAILLVTLLIRVLLFPLTHKSYASMKKMQKLAPKMNAIRDKYKKSKTDAAQRQKMNEELMKLYQAEGYNPMSGCLPMVLQLPILFAFYYVLANAIELRHAPFVLWIRDLSAVDNSYVLVILMVVSMYVQQAMTPSTADPTQKKIFMFMPLLWGWFMRWAPSGLALYWFFSNVLTIIQQMIINKLGDKDEPKAKPARVKSARA